MKKVLVVCSANSCRSQMAEGYLNFYANGALEVDSAGLAEKSIHPLTVVAMEDDNIDLSEHYSKPISNFEGAFFDYVITVCDVADEGAALKDISYDKLIHYDIPDPASFIGTTAQTKRVFFDTRETVKRLMLKFVGRVLSGTEAAI